MALPVRLHEQLSIWLNLANSDPFIEIEARFTRCNITESAWLAINHHLRSISTFVNTETSEVAIYRNNIRKCGDVCVRKEKRTHIDVDTYGVRFALSRETPTEEPEGDTLFVRNRTRHSYRRDGGTPVRFDCTRVQQQGGPDIFEVEIEYVPTHPVILSNQAVIGCFVQAVHDILAVIQSSGFVLSIPICSRLTEAYMKQLGIRDRPVFVGAQPGTLHRKDVREVRKGNYQVSQKVNGTRALLMHFPDRSCFVLDRCMSWRCLLVSSQEAVQPGATLIDVEVTDESVVAIDILVNRGVDLRGPGGPTLHKRIQLLHEFISSSHLPMCTVKNYIPYRWGMQASLTSIMGDGDGLIFVPEDEPYPRTARWPSLLKWKPSHESSVDFVIRGDRPYVGGANGALIEFCPDEKHVKVKHREFTESCSSVVECTYDVDCAMFVPQRVRNDKPRPNYVSVAMDVWKSICNPVDIRQLHIGPSEALKIHLNYVRNTHAHKLARLLQSSNPSIKNFIALDCSRGRDNLRLVTAFKKCGNALEYYEDPKALGNQMAHLIQLHHGTNTTSIEHNYGTREMFTSTITKAVSKLSTDGLISLRFMDGLKVLESSRWGGNSCFTVKPDFDHRLFVEAFDASIDFGTSYAFVSHFEKPKLPDVMCVVMPDALLLHLAEIGLCIAESEPNPEPIDKTLHLTEEECEFNDLFRSMIVRRSTPEKGWCALNSRSRLHLTTHKSEELVVSEKPDEIQSILHMTSGVHVLPTDATLDELATAHSTVIHIADESANVVYTHTPAHLLYIDQPMSIHFVKMDGRFFVVGIRDTHNGSCPHPVQILIPYPGDENLPTMTTQTISKRLVETLESRPMDRSRGSWTIKDLRAFAATEPTFHSLASSLKKKQDIYDELIRLASSTP